MVGAWQVLNDLAGTFASACPSLLKYISSCFAVCESNLTYCGTPQDLLRTAVAFCVGCELLSLSCLCVALPRELAEEVPRKAVCGGDSPRGIFKCSATVAANHAATRFDFLWKSQESVVVCTECSGRPYRMPDWCCNWEFPFSFPAPHHILVADLLSWPEK